MAVRETRYTFELASDACFGASRLMTVGDVDLCTQVDELGLPLIGGRIVKGLVDEQVAVILRALGPGADVWHAAAENALGKPGDVRGGRARFGDVAFPPEVRRFARSLGGAIAPGLVTRAFTDIRAQTRMDATRGTAADHTLRTTRVIRQGTRHLAGVLTFDGKSLHDAPAPERALLVTALGLVRRAGVNRSRGWGSVRVTLDVDAATLGQWRAPLLSILRGEAR
jgi:hypothetical protein